MTIVFKEHIRETEGMVATLLKPSAVMTTSDETKLTKSVEVGLM